MRTLTVLLALLCTLLVRLAQAQVFIQRNYFPVPLDDTTSQRTLFGRAAFNTEGQRGFGSTETEQAWNVKYVGFVEMLRFNRNTAIGLTLAHELSANTRNSIGFHMRGAIWNETLALYHRLGRVTAEIGGTHRCRHEIDNSNPPDEDALTPNYRPTRRLIVLTSPFVALTSEVLPLSRNKKLTVRFYGRFDYFTYRVDGRKPNDNLTQSWDNLRTSTTLGAALHWNFHPMLGVYTRAFTQVAYFSADQPTKANHRVELGVKATGKVADFEFFGAFERFFDDVSRPFPQDSRVIYLGIRGRSRLFF